MQLLIQNIIQSIRSLRTQAWQVGISAVSLAVGIVCLAFSVNWFWTETNYDHFRPDYKNLYIVNFYANLKDLLPFKDDTMDRIHVITTMRYTLLLELREKLADEDISIGAFNENRSRWLEEKPVITKADDDTPYQLAVFGMDSCAAEILGIEALHGNIKDVLGRPQNSAIITDKAAMRIFGRTDVVGEVITEYQRYKTVTYTIKAVCPAVEGMSSFDYDLIVPVVTDATADLSRNYVSFVVRTSDAAHIEERLNALRAADEKYTRKLESLRTYPCLYNKNQSTMTPFIEAYFYHIVFTLISLLLVISAVVNLIMVFTSIYLSRVREYALRRSMGASALQNVWWMLTALMPTLLIAAILAAAGMEWVLALADVPWDTSKIWFFFALIVAATILLCVAGMAYPVRKMQRAYRASFLGHGDGGRSHVWLIVAQCFTCVFLLFISLGMQWQISGMINADLGYNHDNILRLQTMNYRPEGFAKYHDFEPIYKDLTQELRKAVGADIKDVLAMRFDIFNRMTINSLAVVDESCPNYKEIVRDDVWQNRVPYFSLQLLEIPFGAMDFFEMRSEKGAKLRPEDERPDKLQVWLNPEAAELLAPDGNLDKEYFSLFIFREYKSSTTLNAKHWEYKPLNIKDVANIRTNDCFFETMPILFLGVEEFHPCPYVANDAIYIKYEEGRRAEAEAAVRKVLEKFDVPDEEYLLTTFDEHIASIYKKETFIANLLSVLTLFSVVVTLAGVFSMLLYSLRLRRRSMAIHRVMGAGFKDVFVPTLRPYLIYAVVGAVVAYFPASVLVRKWMEVFHYGEAPGVGLMLAILSAMVVIIALIVLWQVRLCMREKPVEILETF